MGTPKKEPLICGKPPSDASTRRTDDVEAAELSTQPTRAGSESSLMCLPYQIGYLNYGDLISVP